MCNIQKNIVLGNKVDQDRFSEVLIYFSESMMDINDEETILWDLAKNCIAKLGFVDCVVYLLDEARNVMIQKAAHGPKNPRELFIQEPVDRPLGFGIVGHVAKSGKAEILHDTSLDSRYEMDDQYRYSEVTVPICIDGKVIGIIDCEHPDRNFFTDHHLHMLMTISSITALKLKGVRMKQDLIQEQARVLDIQNQFIELKLKALRTQLNPHFVFNALNSIQYFIAKNDRINAMKYLSTFSRLIRHYLRLLEVDQVNLKDEIEMLKNYLELQQLRYNGNITYFITINGDSESEIPAFIIQTLLENLTEQIASNCFASTDLQIMFNTKADQVSLDIEYLQYSTQKKNKDGYIPEYRNKLMNWEDQIDFMNKIKSYSIFKEINFYEHDGHQKTKIHIRLPNLKSYSET